MKILAPDGWHFLLAPRSKRFALLSIEKPKLVDVCVRASRTLRAMWPAVASVKVRLSEHTHRVEEAAAKTDSALDLALKVHQQCREERQRLEAKQLSLQARRDELTNLNGNVAATGGDKLKLNVGGANVTALRETLTIFPDSKLAALFSGRWDKKLQRDGKGRIFLDLNPVCFKKILDCLKLFKIGRSPDVPPPLPSIPRELREAYLRQVAFLGLSEPLELDLDRAFSLDSFVIVHPALCAGHIRESVRAEASTMKRRIAEWLIAAAPADPSVPYPPRADLIYRASAQGWSSAAFNATIRNKSATLILAKSEGGHVFGGYAAAPWAANNTQVQAPGAFLFALKCAAKLPPLKLPLLNEAEPGALNMNSQQAIFGGRTLDLSFGSPTRTGGNLMLGTSNLGGTFACPDGVDGQTMLTGSVSHPHFPPSPPSPPPPPPHTCVIAGMRACQPPRAVALRPMIALLLQPRRVSPPPRCRLTRR